MCAPRLVRTASVVLVLSAGVAATASAQTQQLVFTAGGAETTTSDTSESRAAIVAERGLALWSGTASDFGVGASVSGSGWSIRSVTSITALPAGGRDRPTFQQLEVARHLLSLRSLSIAAGGGTRQEWDGTRTLIGRVVAGVDAGGGRLAGSFVVERTFSAPVPHDSADLVTTLGWSRRVAPRISVGFEGIGQDLEGLWDSAEADGGAKLLIGPSIHTHSASGHWAASLTAGPVVRTIAAGSTRSQDGRHFGIFASATWVPSRIAQSPSPRHKERKSR